MYDSLALTPFGLFCFGLFCIAYFFVAAEEKYHLNKAKPALLVGTGLYMLIGIYELIHGGVSVKLHHAVNEIVYEAAALFFFLYAAMIYIEALVERNVFEVLKDKIASRGFSYVAIFWIVGILAFFLGAVAGNLTTALILSALIYAIEKDDKTFLIATSVNIVVASNAGGVWSPFGNVTTLMAWTAGKAGFEQFLYLFPAGLIGWLVSAYLLSLGLPKGAPSTVESEAAKMKVGAMGVIALGLLTVVIAVVCQQVLGLPAVLGMLFGLSLLKMYSYHLKIRHNEDIAIFRTISRIENDTLLFFFGLMGAIGALGYLGFLAILANTYTTFDPVAMNVIVGMLSALLDNVPLMYAIIKANPAMDTTGWLLATLTIGTGGSLISIGSASGIAIMGRLKGIYTFGAHMRLAWTVLVGYVVSIAVWYLQFKL